MPSQFPYFVIPAEAGIQLLNRLHKLPSQVMDPRLRGGDECVLLPTRKSYAKFFVNLSRAAISAFLLSSLKSRLSRMVFRISA